MHVCSIYSIVSAAFSLVLFLGSVYVHFLLTYKVFIGKYIKRILRNTQTHTHTDRQ